MFHCSYKTTSSTKPQSQCYTFGQTLKFKDIFRFSRECTNSPYKRWQYSRKKKKKQRTFSKAILAFHKNTFGWLSTYAIYNWHKFTQPANYHIALHVPSKECSKWHFRATTFQIYFMSSMPKDPWKEPPNCQQSTPSSQPSTPSLIENPVTLHIFGIVMKQNNRIAARLKALN